MAFLINVITFCGIVAVVGGLLCLLNGMYLLAGGRETQAWPETLGRVLKMELGELRQFVLLGWRRQVTLVYEYQARGERQKSSELFFGSHWFFGYFAEDTAQRLLTRYQVGQSIPVRYNHRKPDEAVIETRICWPLVWGFPLLGSALLTVGIAIILYLPTV